MGVLNVTPDSYFVPSRHVDVDAAIQRAILLQEEGADIIDIGGESTRPSVNAYGENIEVSVEEELRRVIPVIKGLKGHLQVPISIDTQKAEVAARALDAGASMINDITGFRDHAMRKIAVDSRAEVCVMHMQGVPQTMQVNPRYEQGVIQETIEWLDKQTQLLLEDGVKQDRIMIDPGIGFGKTMQHNLQIIHHIKEYQRLGFRVLVGASRKLFMAKYLQKTSEDLLFATLGINAFLAFSTVDFIRVHDVKAHRDMINILAAINEAK